MAHTPMKTKGMTWERVYWLVWLACFTEEENANSPRLAGSSDLGSHSLQCELHGEKVVENRMAAIPLGRRMVGRCVGLQA